MSSDRLYPPGPAFLLRELLAGASPGRSLGLPGPLRFTPSPRDGFRLFHQGHELETPLGVAAGPHTQMARNIVLAWLAGARWIELKTVQALDDIRVSKPCIDLRNEGYNCEWSQELSLEQSWREYLHAWVLIHALRRKLGHAPGREGPGFAFNMSAGYDLAGLRSEPVRRFLDRMADAGDELDGVRDELAPLWPELRDLPISSRLSDNITVSTMHGCPPGEIEAMGRYFLEERGLHTTIKLNPTLLGPETARALLDELGWKATVPDEVFARDLRYDEAVELIRSLRETARKAGRHFGVKLTNTLPCLNPGDALPASERLAYMSGRPLHPLAITLAARLQHSFRGALDLSFSAGLDAFNIADSYACGLAPLTVCSDLLRPGGYARLAAMLDALRRAAAPAAGRDRIAALAARAERCARPDGPFARTARRPVPAFRRALPRFDCAEAPCAARCPSGQRQPAYLGLYAAGHGQKARQALVRGNPLHHAQAAFCDALCRHTCEKVCARAGLDSPVRIQAVRALIQAEPPLPPMPRMPGGALIRGDGPAGLACASLLARAGLPVVVETSLPEQQARRIKAMGPELSAGLAADRAVLLRRGARFLPPPLPVDALPCPDAAIWVSADAAPGGDGGTSLPPGRARAAGPASLAPAVEEGRAAALSILQLYGLAPVIRAERSAARARLRHQDLVPDMGPAAVRTASEARHEAGRCLQCDLACGLCVTACPNRALAALPSPAAAVPVLLLRAQHGRILTERADTLLCRDPVQIVHLADFCNACGNCATFCPSSGAPYRDKPRLHLSAASYAGDDAGYHPDGPDVLLGKGPGFRLRLERRGDMLRYEDSAARVVFLADTLEPVEAALEAGVAETRLDHAADALLVWLLTESLREKAECL